MFVAKLNQPKHWISQTLMNPLVALECHGDWSVFLSLERLHPQKTVGHRWAGFNISIGFYWVSSFKGFLCCQAEYCLVISITKDSTAMCLFLILCLLFIPLQLCSHFTKCSHYLRALQSNTLKSFLSLIKYEALWIYRSRRQYHYVYHSSTSDHISNILS